MPRSPLLEMSVAPSETLQPESIVRFVIDDSDERGGTPNDGTEDLAEVAYAALQVPEVAQMVWARLSQETAADFASDSFASDSLAKALVHSDLATAKDGAQRAEAIAQKYENELREVITAATALREMATASSVTLGQKQVNALCVKIKPVFIRQTRTAVRTTFRQLWRLGRQEAGKKGRLSRDERRALEQMYRSIQQYALNFLDDALNGTHTLDFERRLSQYRKGCLQAFNMGFVVADLSHGRYLRWSYNHESVSCGDCLKLAEGGRWKNGVYRAVELAKRGLVPKCSKLKCFSLCNCTLEPATRPVETQTGVPLSKLTLEGVRSSSFEGQGRTKREGYERGVKRHRWTWKRRQSGK